MVYDDLDQFLNKDSITNPVQINSWNVDSIIESWALPSTSIEWWVTKTYSSNSAPTSGMNIWDMWYDTDDGNHAYRWDWSSWVSVKDTTPATQTLDTRWFVNWLTFSSGSYANIAWTSWTLSFADWTSYSISSSSNTNTSTNPVYIYLDTSVSTTALQVTQTASTAVWNNKCLVCVKKTNSDSNKLAIFQVMWWAGSWVFITADQIAANTITANEIAANTITTNQLSATAINGMTITGSTIQTTSTSYPSTGVRITTSWDIRLWWNNAYFYPSSGSSYVGYIWWTSSQFYITSTSWVEFKIGSYGDILLDAPSSYGIRPVRTTNNLGSSSYWWNNIYWRYFAFTNSWAYLYEASSAIQSSSNFRVNGSINLTWNMTFENYASFTIKDSWWTSRTLYCQYNSTLGKYILSS